MINPILHHYAQNIVTGSLETVLELYALLGCKVVYRPNNGYQWAMIAQDNVPFWVQIVEVDAKPITDIEVKKCTHLAFLSDNPQELIESIQTWAKSQNLICIEGGWSEKERYVDFPEVFVNFVIEIMHTSVAEED